MAADNQGGGNADNSNDLLWTVLLVGLAVVGFWLFAHAGIVKGAFYVWRAELKVMSFFTDKMDLLIRWMDVRIAHPEIVTFDQFMYVARNVGSYTGVVSMLGLCGMAWYLMFKMPEECFKRKFDMKGLAKLQSQYFPFILPALNLDLVKQDPTKGDWASAQTEVEFSRANKLLNPDASIDRAKAEKVFVRQLGRSFEGVSRLRDYEKALFALFCARACFDTEAATKLVRQFSESATKTGKVDISGIEEVIAKCRENEEWERVRRITTKHAFVITFMCSMLQIGRQSGVLAPVEFLWLKPLDRTLWYALHQMEPPTTSTLPGQLIRKRVWAEAAGVRAHWIAERLADRPIMMPMVTEAVNGLELAVSEFDFEVNPKKK